MKLKPVLFNVLIEMDGLDEDKYKKHGTLVIPEHIAEKEMNRAVAMVEFATVVELGPTAFREYDYEDRPNIKAGDRVMITLHCGQQKTIDGRPFRIIRDSDILATVLEENTNE
jgi:co-chaperonin GroES (HSP10)